MGTMGEGGLVAGHRCPSYSGPRTQASNSLSWVVSGYSLVCLPLPVNSAALGEVIGFGVWQPRSSPYLTMGAVALRIA